MKRYEGLKVKRFTYEEDDIYFLDHKNNTYVNVWHYDFKTAKLNYLTHIPEKCEHQRRASHISIVKKDDYLYFFPWASDFLYIYDIKKGIFVKKQKIVLELYNKVNNYNYTDMLFIESFVYDKYIFSLSLQGTILRYDTTDGSCSLYNDWHKELLQNDNIDTSKIFCYDGILKRDNSLFFTIVNNDINVIVEFDMKNCASKLHRVGNKKSEYTAIEYNNNNFWLLDNKKNQLICCDKELSIIKKYDLPPKNSPKTFNDRLFMISDKFMGIDVFDNSINLFYVLFFDMDKGIFKESLYNNSFVYIKKFDDIFISFSNNLQKFYYVNYKTSTIKEYALTEEQLIMVDDIHFRNINTSYWVEGNNSLDLLRFLDYTVNNKENKFNLKNSSHNIGSDILTYIIN